MNDSEVGFGPEGRDLWAAIVGEWELRGHERRLLVDACRTADELRVLEDALDALGGEVVTEGSTGQPRVHPLVDAVRAHRLALAKMIAGLRIPDDTLDGEILPRRLAAAALAGARWRPPHGAH